MADSEPWAGEGEGVFAWERMGRVVRMHLTTAVTETPRSAAQIRARRYGLIVERDGDVFHCGGSLGGLGGMELYLV